MIAIKQYKCSISYERDKKKLRGIVLNVLDKTTWRQIDRVYPKKIKMGSIVVELPIGIHSCMSAHAAINLLFDYPRFLVTFKHVIECMRSHDRSRSVLVLQLMTVHILVWMWFTWDTEWCLIIFASIFVDAFCILYPIFDLQLLSGLATDNGLPPHPKKKKKQKQKQNFRHNLIKQHKQWVKYMSSPPYLFIFF
jgi:hypothetical protein